jgi:hypothetical protein
MLLTCCVVSVVGHAIHHLILEDFLGHALMVRCWGVQMTRNWSTLFMACGSMVTFASPMSMVFVWPTFSTMPKSISLVITTLTMGKFAFCAFEMVRNLDLPNTLHLSKVKQKERRL